MTTALYQLTQNYNNLKELLEDDAIPKEVVFEALNGVEEDIKDKAVNIAKFMRNINAEVEQIKVEEERLAARRKALVNKSDGLKEYLYNQMKFAKIQKFKTPLFSFGIQKNPPSVDISEEDKIGSKYLVAQPSIVDKKLLLEDLKAGIIVEGAQIKQGESLRIK